MKEKGRLQASQRPAVDASMFGTVTSLKSEAVVEEQDCQAVNKHNLCQWMILHNRPEFDRIIQLMLMSRELKLRTLI